MSAVIPSAGLSFGENLLLVLIPSIISVGMTVGMFYIMFRTDLLWDMMDKLGNLISKNEHYKDYNCSCSRCQYELRTKRGLKEWKKHHKWKKDEMV